MPSNVLVRLHFPSHGRVLQVKKKLRLDGTYEDDKAGVTVPLANGHSTKTSVVSLDRQTMKGLAKSLDKTTWAGDSIDIDAERGIEIKYTGLGGYQAPDGRFMFASLVKKHARDLQTRGIDFSKFLWPIVIFVLGIMAALVAALAFSVKGHH